ncbi:ras-related protein rab-31-like protein [Pavlovales sp. CCMP2436]|nr:ras-related protein rab-31-like protein [Pavlovales sp. CCMP2436]
MQPVRHDAKVVVLGGSGVGKTCIACRFVKNQFAPYIASTIGASFLVKEVTVGGQKITLQIWDTAGQERFRSMAPLYYRGAVAAILVFDITNELSFEKLKEWVRELQANVEEPLVLAIACNKSDLREQRAVPYELAAQYAAEIGAIIVETSAKENEGVETLFMEVSKRLASTKFRSLKATGTVSMAHRHILDEDEKRKGCC